MEQWIEDRPGTAAPPGLDRLCRSGLQPETAPQGRRVGYSYCLVAAGFGVALVPRPARVPGGEETVRVPLRGDPTPARHVRTSVRAGTSEQPEIAFALHEPGAVAARVAG